MAEKSPYFLFKGHLFPFLGTFKGNAINYTTERFEAKTDPLKRQIQRNTPNARCYNILYNNYNNNLGVIL